MYTSFFGLNEKPFSITPDPRYLFMSERHGEALAHLVYGVTESGGFIQLTGEVGTGKTTLVRTLLQNRLPDNADVAVVLNPQLTALEFLQTICEELGVPEPDDDQSIKSLVDSLNHFLLMAHGEGRRTILVVDEAQNLSRDVLEQVRLLTNLETSKQKLLQIILIGQPELRELLARNDLRQLAQRITGRYHLEPLSKNESAQYIEHRLRVAGALGEVFDKGAKAELFRLSKGVPRIINVICDRALLGAYALEKRTVNRRLVRRAASEISGTAWLAARTPTWIAPSLLTAGVAVIAVGAWSFFSDQSSMPPPQAEPAPAVVQPQPAPIESPVVVAEPLEPEAPPEPDEPDLDEQLVLAGDLTGLESALGSLLGLWGVEYSSDAHPCDQAAEAGYQCFTQRGSWNNLRQLDRPAVLSLTDRRGDSHWAVLTSIEGDRAELSIGGVLVSHRMDAVADLWFGRFYMIWKPPNGVSLDLMPGTRDPNVVWLRQSLAEIDERYRAEPIESDLYDAALEQRVREFQRDNRLTVDGLAGGQTQMIINSLLALEDIPRLVTPRLARD